MKKRVLNISLIFFTLILAVPVVTAAQSGILNVFRQLGQFLFKDLPALGDYGFKFLLWIALFAIFNYGLLKASLDNKTAGIVAFVISLLSVLLIPGKVIKGLFGTYALLIVFALGVFVPLVLIYVVRKIFNGDTGYEKFMRGVTYIVIGYAVLAFTNYVSLTTSGVLR